LNATNYGIFGTRTPWTERAQRAAENALVHLQDVKRAWEGATDGASDESLADRDDHRSAGDVDESDRDAHQAEPSDGKGVSASEDEPSARDDEDEPSAGDEDEPSAGDEDEPSASDEDVPEGGDRRGQRGESQATGVRAARSVALKAAPFALAILIARRRSRAKRRKRFFKKIGASVGGAMIGSAAVAAASDRRLERLLTEAKKLSSIG
jgi:hypothetical protein